MMIPLVPPVSNAVADVAVPALQPLALVTLNDMMQPLPLGQPGGLVVRLLASTLTNIESVDPFKNSATGEQSVVVEARAGPMTGVWSTLLKIGTCHIVGVWLPVARPHTYRLPVGTVLL